MPTHPDSCNTPNLRLIRDRISSQELERLVINLREGVIGLDEQGHICLCNPIAAQLLNLPIEHMINQPLLSLIPHPEHRRAFSQLLFSSDESPQPSASVQIGYEQRLLDVALRCFPPEDNTQIRKAVYLTDITEVAQSTRMKADFVANASHELRTPLSTIKAATETLLASADRLGGHERRFVEVLDKNVERLERLVQDLLDLNRAESSKLQLKIESVHLPTLIQEIERDYHPKISQKGITVIHQLDCPWMDTDHKLLKIVLTNLFDNAAKFVPAQTGRIAIQSRAHRDEIIIEIADNGIGIPPEDCERVFERFYQVDKARSENLEPGTGLGLAIVKHTMAALGGSVQLTSTLGQGTLIQLLWPQHPQTTFK